MGQFKDCYVSLGDIIITDVKNYNINQDQELDIELNIIEDVEIFNRVWKYDFIYAKDKKTGAYLGYMSLGYCNEKFFDLVMPTALHYAQHIKGRYSYTDIIHKISYDIPFTDEEQKEYVYGIKTFQKQFESFKKYHCGYGYCDFIKTNEFVNNRGIGTQMYIAGINHLLSKKINFRFTSLIAEEGKFFREKVLSHFKNDDRLIEYVDTDNKKQHFISYK